MAVTNSTYWADVNNRTASVDPNAPKAQGSSKLGKDEFIKLLMAQMAHQDPTSPMDSQAMTAQLAQFAALEQMQAQNTNLESLLIGQAAEQQMSATSLVGKSISY